MMSVHRVCASTLSIIVFIGYGFSQSCSSSAKCMSIYDCPPILDIIKDLQNISTTQADSLRGLACSSESGRYPYVCCPLTYPQKTTNASRRPVIIRSSNGHGNVLPGRGSCGIQSFIDKVYGGRSTALDEFPWMVLLEYASPSGRTSLSCGGVLINQRYVLTAAHCVVGKIERIVGELVSVRLGEYDISTTIDCIKSTDCADPVQNIGVEEYIPHPGYNEKNPNKTNDIALVRLSEDVVYSDFVKPICLPSTLRANRSEPMSLLQVGGWGRTLNSRQSNTKQKLEVPIMDHFKCREKFAAAAKAYLDDSQLCAGGTFIESTCDGDSGGPLMKLTQNYWVVEGIVSFGRACGLEGWPGVFTRVLSFENWIESTMRP